MAFDMDLSTCKLSINTTHCNFGQLVTTYKQGLIYPLLSLPQFWQGNFHPCFSVFPPEKLSVHFHEIWVTDNISDQKHILDIFTSQFSTSKVMCKIITLCNCECNTEYNGHSSSGSRAQIHQLPQDFAGKGVLNVWSGVLPKWYLQFYSYEFVTHTLACKLVIQNNCKTIFFIIKQWFYWYFKITVNNSMQSRLVGWEIKVPFQQKKGLYQGHGHRWRFSFTRLRMANDTVTSRPCCLFAHQRPKMGKDRGGSFMYYAMPSPTTGWKLTNQHSTYLSDQCVILCNCCSSVPITYQCLMTLVVYYLFWVCLLLLSKTQKKHLRDLPPMVPDLLPSSPECNQVVFTIIMLNIRSDSLSSCTVCKMTSLHKSWLLFNKMLKFTPTSRFYSKFLKHSSQLFKKWKRRLENHYYSRVCQFYVLWQRYKGKGKGWILI